MTPYQEEDLEPTSTFTNSQVYPHTLPTLATLEYQPLERNLLKANMIWSLLFFSVAAIVSLVLRFVFDVHWMIDYGPIVWSIIFLLLLLSLAYTYFEFRRKSYALREKDIIYNNGLFWQSSIVIPFNRVQHCEVAQGPIDRFYGLAELKIFTAGGSSSDLQIDGLSPETAQRIKDFIVHKTASDEEE